MRLKNNALAIAITGLLIFPAGLIIGRVTAEEASTEAVATETSHSDSDTHSSDTHSHGLTEVDAANAPAITNFAVTKDAKSGWNVSFETTNFTFSPENASGEAVDGEGHAHLYIDGEKITRMYGPNFHIDHLDEGEREISVTLNSNDHKDYAVNGEVVRASATVMDSHHANDTHSDSEETTHSRAN